MAPIKTKDKFPGFFVFLAQKTPSDGMKLFISDSIRFGEKTLQPSPQILNLSVKVQYSIHNNLKKMKTVVFLLFGLSLAASSTLVAYDE